MKLKTDTAAKEIIASLKGLPRDEIWASYDLTEIVSGVDIERYAEDAEYSESVMTFVLGQR